MAHYNSEDIEPKISALDLALFTYIVRGAAPLFGRTKVQKTVFLVEFNLGKHQLTGPSFRFFRYNNGPFSGELWTAYDVLAARGHAHKHHIGLTARGEMLAQLTQALGEDHENRELFRIMDTVIRECQPQSGEKLMNKVYQLKLRPPGYRSDIKIEDIPIGIDLIVPSREKTLHVSPDLAWLIEEEAKLTDMAIEASHQRRAEWDRKSSKNLARAIDAATREQF